MEAETKKATATEPVEWIRKDGSWYALIRDCTVYMNDLGQVFIVEWTEQISDLRAIADACDAKLAEVKP